jgi:hypothetical protein
MGGAIANVRNNATNIMNAVLADAPNAQFCVAEYKDFTDPFAYRLNQSVTGNTALVQVGINQWIASGGGDTPEAQLNALSEMANPSNVLNNPGFRAGSTRIIVWFGDAPGHDPSGGHTLASTTNALTTSGSNAPIIVIALSVGFNQLNATGQASAIANATGGLFMSGVNEAAVADAIIASLQNLDVEVAMQSDCASPIHTSFSPASQTVQSGTDAVFTETIARDNVAAPGVYECDDWATINGNPMTDASGNVIKEHKRITIVAGPPAVVTLDPPTATNTAGEEHCVTATVTDAFGNPNAGVSVVFSVSGANSAGGTAVTNASGQATFCYTGTVAGDDTITAFADTNGSGIQDGGEPSATASKTYEAGPPAFLSATPKSAINEIGDEHCVKARVEDQFGNPTPDITVVFSVSGANTASGSATTGAAGTAVFCYTGTNTGPDVIVVFADTDNDGVQDADEPGDEVDKLWFAFADGGVFVIGDLTPHGNGMTVNWWGSQWHKNNTLSGGSAPASFKGFENSNPSPACGTKWATDPGNSSNPPPTVPEYMAVVVSSKITKSGSTISGDVKEIVIVKNNPGYDDNPGHHGNGVVVATLCTTP